MKRVLFIGAGRRYELAKRWADYGYQLYFYENSKNVPVRSLASYIFIGKDFRDTKGFKTDIEKICLQTEFDFVFPCFDPAILPLAEMRQAGWNNFIVSDIYGATISWDKKALELEMEKRFSGFYPSITRYTRVAIAKDRFGYGSKGIMKVQLPEPGNNSQQQLNTLKQDELKVYQDFIFGTEYSVDCYFDSKSEFVDGVIRTRDAIAGGEVISSTTVDDKTLWKICKLIGTNSSFRGPVNMQFIKEKTRDATNHYLLEINARFGGGFPFSIDAGLNVIRLLERDYQLKPFTYTPYEWKKNLHLERSYRDHIFYGDILYYENSN